MNDKAARDYIADRHSRASAGTLVREVADSMAIYNGGVPLSPEAWLPQAGALVRSFEAVEGRTPNDYLEIDTWSAAHLDKGGRFLVVK